MYVVMAVRIIYCFFFKKTLIYSQVINKKRANSALGSKNIVTQFVFRSNILEITVKK